MVRCVRVSGIRVVEGGSTMSIDAEACRCWTRVIRQSTVLFRVGRVFNLRGCGEGFVRAREIVMVGKPDLLEAGIVETEPMIEAQILES
jgi:hypothetical protein